MEKENKRKKLTKRGKLLLTNIISLVLVIFFALLDYWFVSENFIYIALKYLLIQFAVGVGSAIVYYLSIIADVMTKQNERAERDRLPRDYDKKN